MVEVYSRPEEGIFKETVRAKQDDTLSPKTATGLELAVGEILG